MKQLLFSMTVVALAAQSANASFLIDDFDTPAIGAHQSNGSMVALNSPPNFFANRQMDGTDPSNLVVDNFGISGFFGGGQSAWIEWTVPSENSVFAGLEFQNFTLGFSDVTYDVTLNGATLSGGPQALASTGIMRADASILNPGDALRITFSSSTLGSFSAGGIQANPEPASAMLLGGLMFGGICRFRRRRNA